MSRTAKRARLISQLGKSRNVNYFFHPAKSIFPITEILKFEINNSDDNCDENNDNDNGEGINFYE